MTKDIRLSIGFLDHPKTIKIQRMLGSDGVLSLVRLWVFAAQYKPDGVLSGMDADDIEIASKWNGMQGALLTALLTHKWVDEKTDENGLKTYLLHDWEDHQGYVCHSKDRSRQAKRAAETRWKNKDKCSPNADSIEGAMLKDAKRNAPSPNPYPLPSPEPKDKKKKDIPPKIEDVTAYCQERKNGIDAQYWWDSYQAKGWMIGNNKMKDWKAAIHTWEKNNKTNPLFQNQNPNQNQDKPMNEIDRQLAKMRRNGEI